MITYGLAHATGVHERNTVPYARFALKKRHGFCAKAREKNMQRRRLGTLQAQLRHVLNIAKAHFRHSLGTVLAQFRHCLGTNIQRWALFLKSL